MAQAPMMTPPPGGAMPPPIEGEGGGDTVAATVVRTADGMFKVYPGSAPEPGAAPADGDAQPVEGDEAVAMVFDLVKGGTKKQGNEDMMRGFGVPAKPDREVM